MPAILDPETIYVDDLPGIWSPVQWELTLEEHAHELEEQATASLLKAINAPEAILRLALDETGIQRSFEPPDGYNPELQGEWNNALVTFEFRRGMRLERVRRDADFLYVEYNCGDLGRWGIEFETEKITIERL